MAENPTQRVVPTQIANTIGIAARSQTRRSSRMPRRKALAMTVFALLLASASAAQPSGPEGNLPLPPDALEHRLQYGRFEITAVGDTHGRGILSRALMDVHKLTLVFPEDGFSTGAKWRAAPGSGEGWDNSPRREIAAYAVQQLFLDPAEYVVPPTAARCIDLATYGPINSHPQPTFPDTRCVFGVLAAWLQHIETPDDALESERFSRDLRYAYSFGNVNIFTYLIAHRDASVTNFVISTDPNNPQLFSIDNGIAFSGMLYNFFVPQFDHIVVGGLPQRTVDRLRRLTPTDFERLGAIDELRAGADGVLRSVPPSANADPDEGTRLFANGIQLGLTRSEIDAMKRRWHQLLDRIDRGELPTFDAPLASTRPSP